MRSTVAVFGAGAWGTTVAKVIAEKGHDVVIWCHELSTEEEINRNHTNLRFLPGITLPETLKAMADIEKAALGREYIILAIPSLFLLEITKQLLVIPSIREGESVIGVITKGFLETPKGPRLILETLEDYLPGFYRKSLVYVAGPSHAEEVSRGKITGLIAASESAKNAVRFRYLLKNPKLLVFSSLDVRGVQVAAAVKNVIAIAFGIMDALKTGSGDVSNPGVEDMFGDGTESLLLAAGLNEIQALGMVMGATHPETFSSISGVGDLDVTCRSVFGRNRRFGREIIEKNILASFKNLDDLISRIGEVGYLPEGVAAARCVKILSEKYKVKMPISIGMHRILNKEIGPVAFLYSFLTDLG
ncbi:MAG: NAD(P)-dependent glycerol-3-phosphate dehydrogenase [Spirochaetaceae bacterium]|jgi:glycerol-3-phosphate dehydrogenase (NAD(P)+)|nr:NAD(P)-dependent glycerol-3-phosphate dehydrogenase [Spirochaetaceae bacterium]